MFTCMSWAGRRLNRYHRDPYGTKVPLTPREASSCEVNTFDELNRDPSIGFRMNAPGSRTRIYWKMFSRTSGGRSVKVVAGISMDVLGLWRVC